MGKISRGEPRNLANWPAKFGKICHGKLWSLLVTIQMCYTIEHWTVLIIFRLILQRAQMGCIGGEVV